MDTFIAIGIAVGVFLLGVAISYFVTKINLTKEQIINGLDIAEVVYALVEITIKDSGMLDDKENVDDYFYIISRSLDYMSKIMQGTQEEIINEGVSFAEDLFTGIGYELNDAKRTLIRNIIKMSYNLYMSLLDRE